jgi:PTH1 family peptidyl-tRNA hydrolase
LGNPGGRYLGTRHNLGFQVIDRLARDLRVRLKRPLLKKILIASTPKGSKQLFLVKPLTFMNRSGQILTDVLRLSSGGLGDLLIVCDTLDLPPGSLRLKMRGSSGGHRGLESFIRHAGTTELPRIRVGVGRPPSKQEAVGYVLEPPGYDEQELINQAIDRAASGILRLLVDPPESVMNVLNTSL